MVEMLCALAPLCEDVFHDFDTELINNGIARVINGL
jgi:hypothetical protein